MHIVLFKNIVYHRHLLGIILRITILTGQIEELQGVVPIGKFNERGVITASYTRTRNLEVTACKTNIYQGIDHLQFYLCYNTEKNRYKFHYLYAYMYIFYIIYHEI